MKLTSESYTTIVTTIAEVISADCIGVVSEAGQAAVGYAGGRTLARYMDGTCKQSVLLQITGMDTNENQEALVERLAGIAEILKGKDVITTLESADVVQPKIRLTSPPTPITHNEHFWIYSMNAEIIYYSKG